MMIRLSQRVRKKRREYAAKAHHIPIQWEQVKQHCTQAERFEQSVQATVTHL